jgi:hypothetical protein
METERNTGLGGSLLLQRTDVHEQIKPLDAPLEIPEVKIAAEPESAQPEVAMDERPRRLRVKKAALVLRDRCTLYLEREVNDQLDIAARIQGRERSELVSELLRKHLPKYQVERRQ